MTFLWLDGITDWVWANSKRTEGQGSLASCSPWDHKESHTTEWLNNNRFQDQYSILTHTADKKHNRGFTYPSSENLEKSFSSKAIINQKNSIFWISKFNQPGNLQQAQANRRAWKQPSVTCLSTSRNKGTRQSPTLLRGRGPHPGRLSTESASPQPVGDGRLCAIH